MSDKTMPEWGEIVHINGEDHVVIEVGRGWVAVADRSGDQKDVDFLEIEEYKTRTIIIGDMKVPEPVREPLKRGDAYWRVGLDATPECGWTESPDDYIRLYQGRIHRTKEAAEQHRKALIRVSGGKTE